MRERWIDCDGCWIHTVDWEPAAASVGAEPIVLVHGLGGSTVNWDLVGPTLAMALGTRLTALDLPGFGRTRTHDRPASSQVHHELLVELLGAREPGIVIGNSMGGALGVAIAVSNPELVTRLVLVNAALPRRRGNAEQLDRTAKLATLMLPIVATPLVRTRAPAFGPEGLVDATLGNVLARPDALDPEVRRRLVALAAERMQHPGAAPAYAQSGGTLFRYLVGRMTRDLAEVCCPTLVLHGARDRLVPVDFARAAARRRADWRYVELADIGHAPQLEVPEAMVQAVTGWLEAEHTPIPTGW
ncbi:MAG: alpha/beta hydrolase [Actinobacteria bacterium]|nr:alpha/beta hydrolase [Actinomycetota bacterium]